MSLNNLYDAVSEFDSSQAKTVREYSGLLGLTPTSQSPSVPNRNGYVYVRFRDNQSEIVQAYNETVSPKTNLPVIVIRRGTGWYIKGRDTERYSDWGSDSAFLPNHHWQHEFNPDAPGGDITFIYPQQITPLLITPSGTNGGPNVVLQSLNFKRDDGTWLKAGITGSPNLLVHKPTNNQALIGLVYFNRNTGNPGFFLNSGSFAPASTTGTHALLQYLPSLPNSDYEPLAMVRMVSGTSSIKWENLYDIRQWFGGMVSGTGGGGVEEAPIDGLTYGRKNAGWTQVSGTSGGDATLTANRVVVTNDVGNQTTSPLFQFDYDNNALVVGGGISNVPAIGAKTVHILGSGSSPSWNLWAWGSNVAGFNTFVRARGDWDTPQAIQDGDVIGRPARFRAYDGATYPATRAEIRGQARGNWDTGSHGTEIVMGITPSGTTSMDDFLTINQAGLDILYGTYNISGSPHIHNEVLPFGVYVNVSPMSVSPSYPYSAAVDKNFTLKKWTQSFVVLTTNDASNFWEIKLYEANNSEFNVVGKVDTKGGSPNVWQRTNTTTFDIPNIDTSFYSLYFEVAASGTPGNLYLSGPIITIEP